MCGGRTGCFAARLLRTRAIIDVKQQIVQFLIFAVGFVAVLVLAICALLYFQQDSILFYPVKTDAGTVERWKDQRVEIPSDDGPIEGWWLDKPESTSQTVVLYFGGNAEEVLSSAVDSLAHLDVRRMLVTNYRGYGRTPGRPGQDALFSDALTVYDYAIKRLEVASGNVVVVGRSLGSGVATYVAAHRPVRGVVLITPYDSIKDVAQGLYPLLPVGMLIEHPFRSDLLAPKLQTPVLMLAAAHDSVIPARHAQRLFDAWAGPKQIHILSGVGHNDITDAAQYYPLLNAFLGMPLQPQL
jgi:pimeloyl-ACP methyl ester carboxylesterase